MSITLKHRECLLILTVIILASTLICIVPSSNAQETETLKPIEDSSVLRLQPNSNLGVFWKLQVSAAVAEPGESRAYLMFDLKDVPNAIQSAELSLFCDNLTETQTIEAHFCSDNTWTETGITWNNAPSFSTVAISVVVTKNNEWYQWDIASNLKRASEMAGKKLALVLVDTTATENGYVEFYSRDGIGGLRPFVTITYVVAPAGFPVSLLIEATVVAGALLGVAFVVYFKFLKQPPAKGITKPTVPIAEKPATESTEKLSLIEGSRAAIMFHHVSGIMNNNVEMIESSKRVFEAVTLMGEKDAEYLVVLENGKPVGMLTETDFFKRVAKKGLDPKKTAVEEVMSKPLITLGPDSSIEDAAKMMITRKISKLPVTEGSKVVGIVTETELIRTLWNLLFLLP